VQTFLNPAVLVAILIAGVFICFGSRKQAAAAFLAASLLIPTDQVLLIGSLHFFMLRLLIVFGVIRMVREKAGSKLAIFSHGINKIDIAVILSTIFMAVNGSLLFRESAAVINQIGNVYTVFGVYFLLRLVIRDGEDVVSAIRTLACITVVVAAVMIYEQATGHNPYAMLGGARVSNYASLVAREARYRAQGPFGHSILAGTFGAVMVPLFVALWWKSTKYRALAAVGVVSSSVITLASNSSTPVMGYAAGLLALGMWPLRKSMRAVRWGIVAVLVGLHLVMKGPVWSLIEKIDIAGGSSSWHRYMLVDQCIRRIGEWWLFGVKDTSVWGWDMWDTANQYVSICENFGLLPFLLFVAVLIYGFKYLGKGRRAAGQDKKTALFMWALGAALFANVISFLGVSYFDQTMVAWYALLAMIPAAIAGLPKKRLQPVPVNVASHEADSDLQLVESPAVFQSAHPELCG
jgi:hypothetical protein